VAGTKWHDFERLRKQQSSRRRLLVHYMRHPVVVWLFAVGVANGVAAGTWAAGGAGAAVGAVAGALFGAWLAHSPTLKRHWYEVCYWSHCAIAYSTVALALVARFDVFWPCATTWSMLALDKVAQCASTRQMYVDLQQSRCILDKHGKPSKLCLVLRAKKPTRLAASRWVYLSVSHMCGLQDEAWVERRISRAWHPLSLAAQSESQIELLIDVHSAPKGKSWSQQLFAHVAELQRDTHASARASTDDLFARPLQVKVRGPFGSAFARCFDMMERVDSVDAARYDIVVLFGSGIGLPSALSALHEFVRRRQEGWEVPRFVWFLWQCRSYEDLQLCWDSLHRLVYSAKGLSAAGASEGLPGGMLAPLDFQKHKARNGGQEWTENARMLEWLGVTLFVSSWAREKQTEKDCRAALEADNPLLRNRTDDVAAERVHRWLCHKQRLRAGYHDLDRLLVELDGLDHEVKPHQVRERRLCVSLCGSEKAFLQTKSHLERAKEQIRKKERHRVMSFQELAADYHG